jgi:uncharacterized protein HemX
MSESNPHEPGSQESSVHHLPSAKQEPESARAPAASGAPAPAKGGGHMTGLLGLLLAVAIFAFLAQFSANRQLTAEVQGLRQDLSTALTQLEASRGRAAEARGVVANVRSQLEELDALLAPEPGLAPAGAPGAVLRRPARRHGTDFRSGGPRFRSGIPPFGR